MHERGDMDLTMSTCSLNSGRRTCVSLLDRAVFVTRSVSQMGVGETEGVRGGEGKEGCNGGGKSTDVGLERPCCCIVCK